MAEKTVLITHEDYKASIETIASLRAEKKQLTLRLEEKDALVEKLLEKLIPAVPSPPKKG